MQDVCGLGTGTCPRPFDSPGRLKALTFNGSTLALGVEVAGVVAPNAVRSQTSLLEKLVLQLANGLI